MSDGTDSIRAIPVNVSGAKRETKVNQGWIDHQTAIDSIEQIVQVAQMSKTSSNSVSVKRNEMELDTFPFSFQKMYF